jgi:HAD superfamily hydrolase (TIGR01509 family)
MKLKLPDGAFKAYLFDCDGTIVDSMPLHYVTWGAVLSEFGIVFEEELFYAWGGRPVPDIFASLNELHGVSLPQEDMMRRKKQMYFDMLPELQAVPEVMEHILESHGKVPFAVVSGSTRASVVASLEVLGILDRFDTLVCAEDYAKGKPDPEPFLLAAKRLGVDPGDCLVFEDTQMGIDAAIAAGMAWVKVMQPLERAKASAAE